MTVGEQEPEADNPQQALEGLPWGSSLHPVAAEWTIMRIVLFQVSGSFGCALNGNV